MYVCICTTPEKAKKQKKTALPAVKTKDGHLCSTPAEAQDRWIEFFSHMEGGENDR